MGFPNNSSATSSLSTAIAKVAAASSSPADAPHPHPNPHTLLIPRPPFAMPQWSLPSVPEGPPSSLSVPKGPPPLPPTAYMQQVPPPRLASPMPMFGAAGIRLPRAAAAPPAGQFAAFNQFTPRPTFFANPLMPRPIMPPRAMARYPPPYSAIARGPNLPRLPTLGPIPSIRSVGPIILPAVLLPQKYSLGMSDREMSNAVGQFIPDKPQTTVYVGKIATTLDDELIRPLLELCGSIKSWKRAQDPSTGAAKGFGFCEFETAEGVLRALRLLNKLSLDGQELMRGYSRQSAKSATIDQRCVKELNVTQATREYLERYVRKKTELEKERKEAEVQELSTAVETASGIEKIELGKQAGDDELVTTTENASAQLDYPAKEERGEKFGLVNSDDMKRDDEARKKLAVMLEERSKQRPLPPPPPLCALSETPTKSNSVSETPEKMKDIDSIADMTKNAADGMDGRNEDDITSENKPSLESDLLLETSPLDRGRYRSRDRASKEMDREREIKKEEEEELERYEREKMRERLRREKERERRLRNAEQRYEERERQWTEREREKERQRQMLKEKEKEWEKERKREIKADENESNEENWRKRRYRGGDSYDEVRKRRRREKEDDEMDRLKEEEEESAQEQQENMRMEEAGKKTGTPEELVIDGFSAMDADVCKESSLKQPKEANIVTSSAKKECLVNMDFSHHPHVAVETEERHSIIPVDSHLDAEMEERQSMSPALRKLGFGFIGSGKEATIPAPLIQGEREESPEHCKLQPFAPIDYLAEQMRAVAPAHNLSPSHSAERDYLNHTAEEKEWVFENQERDQMQENDRVHMKEEFRDEARDIEGGHCCPKDVGKDLVVDKANAFYCKKPLDVKQLIDTIPKTKEDLFAFNIDWTLYDKHNLHERLRPWISKKIIEFLGEEETTLVDYIISNTKKHVTAERMLELLGAIFDDEAEIFVLKMWRMLIFEVRKVEAGLTNNTKA